MFATCPFILEDHSIKVAVLLFFLISTYSLFEKTSYNDFENTLKTIATSRKEGGIMKGFNRILSFLLVICLLVSVLPTQVFATVTEANDDYAVLVERGNSAFVTEQGEPVAEKSVSETFELVNAAVFPEIVLTEENTVNLPEETVPETTAQLVVENDDIRVATTHVIKNVKVSGMNQGFRYQINNGATVTIIEYTGTEDEVTIPAQIEGKPVVEIGNNAFNARETLSSITIPNTVKSIGYYAFYGCENLIKIVIPNSVLTIEYNAFANCTGLESITLSDNLITIGEEAFSNCVSLMSVVVPNSVISMGMGAFAGCTNLQSITLPFLGKERIAAFDEYNYPLGYIFGSDRFADSTRTLQYFGNSVCNTYYIPNSLTSIKITDGDLHYGALYNCKNLTSVKLGTGVTRIGAYSLYGCTGLTELVIPDNVTHIGDSAFCKCTNLARIAIPNSVSEIDDCAFQFCSSLTSVNLPNGLAKIEMGLFDGCGSLAVVIIPESVISIENNAFSECFSLEEVYFGGNVLQWENLESNRPFIPYVHYTCTSPTNHWISRRVDVTCEKDGFTSDCCTCGFERNKVITEKAKGHSFENWEKITAPTCIEKGSERRDCANCDHFETREIDAKGHDHKTEVTAPTCTEKGYTTHTCFCGDSYVDTYVDALGHKFGEWEVVKAPTHAEKGSERRDCANCDHFETREVDVLQTAPGDMNGDESVNDDDVILLLWHTLLPDMYPIEGEADFNYDGNVNDEDVIYLLWHTLIPELYPL